MQKFDRRFRAVSASLVLPVTLIATAGYASARDGCMATQPQAAANGDAVTMGAECEFYDMLRAGFEADRAR